MRCECRILLRYKNTNETYYCKRCKRAYSCTFADPGLKLDPEELAKYNGKELSLLESEQ